MLLSMTGYGRSSVAFKEKTISVEVKSLNSKFTDLRIKIPQNFREKETELRKMVVDGLKGANSNCPSMSNPCKATTASG